MKKLFSILFIATMVSMGMALASCDDDKEPEIPTGQTIESVTESENDARLVFEFNNDKDSCSIYLYSVVFTIGERQSPPLNIRIDAPYTYLLKTFNITGNNITPYLLSGKTPVPMPDFIVTDLIGLVNLDAKVYSISFDCHGGHYYKTGKLK